MKSWTNLYGSLSKSDVLHDPVEHNLNEAHIIVFDHLGRKTIERFRSSADKMCEPPFWFWINPDKTNTENGCGYSMF